MEKGRKPVPRNSDFDKPSETAKLSDYPDGNLSNPDAP